MKPKLDQELNLKTLGGEKMKHILKRVLGMAIAIPLAISISAVAAQAEKIRIALAETPSDELAAFFVALDRAKTNGLDYE